MSANKAQATLEFSLVFIIVVALLFGLLALWKWSSDNIIKRQQEYNAGRLEAGSSSPGKPLGEVSENITDNQTYLFR